ncbi:unnamed protein product [Discosporangium mesarthrocarpum]
MGKMLLEIYEGRDLGTPDKLVGVRIIIRKDGITLDYALYAQGIVMARMGSLDVRKTTTPLDPGMVDLSARRDDEEELDTARFPYSSILGKLMFLAGMSRPDLATVFANWGDGQPLHACGTGAGYNRFFATSPLHWTSASTTEGAQTTMSRMVGKC